MSDFNIDEILNAFEPSRSTTPSVASTVAQEVPLTPEEATPEVSIESSFSDEDINNILEDNGFTTSVEEESSEQLPSIEDINTYDDNEESDEEESTDTTEEEPFLEQSSETSEETTEETPTEDVELLPENSPTLLVDESTTRFSGASWFTEIQKSRVIIAGIGGIGSNVAFQLARMVPASITMYDDDNVETVNMAGQLFSHTDIGSSKVSAISTMISNYTNMRQVYALKERFTESSEPGDIMICGFDNMVARKTFFRAWEYHVSNKSPEDKKNCILIDGRLSMDTLQILCITGDNRFNINRYKREFLFSDSEADETICSMKQTTYLACMIGSLMVNMLTNFIANKLDPIIPFDLPFFTEYDAQNVIFKTEN